MSETLGQENTILTVKTNTEHQNYTLANEWGSTGSAAGQFNNPSGIAIDSNTNEIYVVDTGNNRIQKFSPDGTFLMQ